ncbi:hypothetical protein Purlil1_9603 [Purpureocillium lilacinum]|uniref:Uncharacterized protein n=1 Tax=Purpureocillium lilacinum TaxID=33203 RepID=A0ABR0BQA2_PURLI|nr:hypothetical protein Purlil1_9603 [Purpureocillium lilacinum]
MAIVTAATGASRRGRVRAWEASRLLDGRRFGVAVANGHGHAAGQQQGVWWSGRRDGTGQAQVKTGQDRTGQRGVGGVGWLGVESDVAGWLAAGWLAGLVEVAAAGVSRDKRPMLLARHDTMFTRVASWGQRRRRRRRR